VAHHLTRVVFFASLCGCSGSITPPVAHAPSTYQVGLTTRGLTTADEVSGGPCTVSSDGFVWYALPSGAVAPLDFTTAKCSNSATIDAGAYPQLPAWSRSTGGTQAIFVATSLQEAYSPQGMQDIERIAEGAGVPVTWMIGNGSYLTRGNGGDYYNQIHAANGDDVELEDNQSLYSDAQELLPWYAPAVSVEGAGHERNIAGATARGNAGFWGITWNSHGTDSTSDEGAPWGAFCSDPTSYKRPSPSGDCALISFEWTARDLTRAYLSNTNAQGYSAEAAFSTDPDDILKRAGFDEGNAVAYVRSLVDAYAAAGVTQPLVVVSQQESAEEASFGSDDDPVLAALYAQAVGDGMKPMTLREALVAAKAFAAQPRAIAFPFIGGGIATQYNGVPFTPGTIDFHDDLAGMTFLAGHTMPSRISTYADDPVSTFNRTLAETLPNDATYPQLLGVTAAGGALSFSFQAPAAIHIGVALWTNPARLMLAGANVVPAGGAGVVITFDLPAGYSTQKVSCGGCTSTTFSYST